MHCIAFQCKQHYLPGQPVVQLSAVCEQDAHGAVQRACITGQSDRLASLLTAGHSLDVIARVLAVALIDFTQPWSLKPVHIAKPWGQEIWYTGIEVRGVSQVVTASGTTPLDWAIALDVSRSLGTHRQPTLLKILDPLPDDVFGDLYFELHERKREVYVVTHVNQEAWPDEVGAIRYGFSPTRRAQFDDEAAFMAAYRHAVHQYHAVRRTLDQALDALRRRDGVDLQEPVSAAQTQRWLTELSQETRSQEATLRAQMDNFTALRPLRVGDVVAVPLRTPHALQHGVRTVEFQTPEYERKILSFAQKVLTQDHWDTEEALALACIQTPTDQPFPLLHDAEGVRVEQIVTFDDFIVQRVHLAPGAQCRVGMSGQQHAVCMTVTGTVQVGGLLRREEEAALVPAAMQGIDLSNETGCPAVCLVSLPQNTV